MANRKRQNQTLFTVLVSSAALHIAALLGFGSFVIWEFTMRQKPEFEAPPSTEAIEPPNLEYRATIQSAQQQAPQPQLPPIQVTQISDMNTPEMNITMPQTLGDVNLAGMGQGNISGMGGAGLTMGEIAVDFFGLKSQAERIVLIVDVAESMAEPERGDYPGFQRVKDEFAKVINGLNPATVFNVVAFERSVNTFSQNLVPATPNNKEQAIDWLQPYYAFQGTELTGLNGTRKRESPEINFEPVTYTAHRYGGTSRMDEALVFAFQQKPQAIFMITDGTPNIRRELEGNEIDDYEKKLEEYNEKMEDWELTKEEKEAHEKKVAAWKKKQEAQRQARIKKGLPPDAAKEGGGGRPGVPKPNRPASNKPVSDERFIEEMERAANFFYRDGDSALSRFELPSLFIIGYSVNDKTADFLEELESAFPRSDFRAIGAFLEDEDD